MKYNCVIMLKEILKHISHYSNDDVKEWMLKKAFKVLALIIGIF
jgi:hypothetical protein